MDAPGPCWRVVTTSRPHPGKGHDRHLSADGFVGVADGATPLEAGWPDSGEFAAFALSALAAGRGTPQDAFRAAIRRAAEVYDVPDGSVSCAVAVAVFAGARVTVAVLGDCVARVELADGRSVEVTDPAVQRLDALAAGEPDAERARRRLLEHRRTMNTDGGYWIFARDPRAADHLRSLTVDEDELVSLTLLTDGGAALLAAADPADDATVVRVSRRGP